jgi:CheY-like chemotaxis protein
MEILIVEDHPLQLHLMQALLVAEGYVVSHAATGVAALRRVREQMPDLILMDVCLPGISGFEVAFDLRRDPEFRDLPIALMSAGADSSDRDRAAACGCDAFFAKPIDTRTFAADIARLLGRRVTGEE